MEEINSFFDAANYAAKSYDGDLLEIGVGSGICSMDMLQVAEQYDRKVYGIDPFEKNWNNQNIHPSYTKPYPLHAITNILEHPRFTLHQENSNHISSKGFANRMLCFAHVDGDQTTSDIVLADIEIVSNAKIIAVDDYNRHQSVKDAVHQFISKSNREIIKTFDKWVLIK